MIFKPVCELEYEGRLSSVELITVSVWFVVPPVCEAWTHTAAADNIQPWGDRSTVWPPAANHFIPLAVRYEETRKKITLSENVLSPPALMRCAQPDLFCLFIFPSKRPVEPLIVGGKWNKGPLLAAALISNFISATKTSNQSFGYNHLRTSWFCHGIRSSCYRHFGVFRGL